MKKSNLHNTILAFLILVFLAPAIIQWVHALRPHVFGKENRQGFNKVPDTNTNCAFYHKHVFSSFTAIKPGFKLLIPPFFAVQIIRYYDFTSQENFHHTPGRSPPRYI